MNYLSAVLAVFHVVFGKRAAEDYNYNIRVFWKCKNISEIWEAMFLKTAYFITKQLPEIKSSIFRTWNRPNLFTQF